MAKSRKRSDSSVTPKPPEPPVFFVDRCLGRHEFPAPLRDAGLRVEVHDDHFADDCADEDWLPAVGRYGWVVITRDLKIRYRAIEKEAALSNGVRMISLTARRLSAGELGEAFVASSDRVMRFLGAQRLPFIATMTRGGQLRIVATTRGRSRDRR